MKNKNITPCLGDRVLFTHCDVQYVGRVVVIEETHRKPEAERSWNVVVRFGNAVTAVRWEDVEVLPRPIPRRRIAKLLEEADDRAEELSNQLTRLNNEWSKNGMTEARYEQTDAQWRIERIVHERYAESLRRMLSDHYPHEDEYLE